MRDLNYQLKQICHRNRDGSYSTQAKRFHHLMMMANQLHDLGFRGMTARSLKPKHVDALVKHWMEQELAVGTIKNRMSVLRWWAEKVAKQNVIARSNEHYGIPDRQFVSSTPKATGVTVQELDKITDPYVRMSLELQQAFGLRREEAIKFIPSFADRGNHITLKSTWTKGGKERDVPVRTDVQREVLKRAHQLAGSGSLIPQDRNYIQQLRVYERQTANAGLSKLHGLRHAYAQARYEELTGWKAPAAGGPVAKALSPGQKVMDRQARRTVSRELGHIREQITSVYLSR
ncbi:MAG: integrase domain-containing protein [Candidatus Thiodiazotropha sp. (ex Ctena orbiculata)]|uniref:Integrase domain-containing protein n=1 Tax=Candidatus Thiodiazotropha taylori TaxID=2792791 RepID=A0A944QVE3_9GAMM|nr:integrase domain-containing protein [Candidatus Thiodiazotropha taylori]